VSEEPKMAEEPAQTVRELTKQEKANLARDVIQNGTEEARYILTLAEWEYFHSRAEIKIIAGKVDMIVIDKSDKPGNIYRTFAIIPRTDLVEIKHRTIDYNKDDDMEHVTLYVFTLAGWKSFPLY